MSNLDFLHQDSKKIIHQIFMFNNKVQEELHHQDKTFQNLLFSTDKSLTTTIIVGT
jgi:hypothetical protein